MGRLYTNENMPRQVVDELRRLGHDVLTSLEAGNANAAVPDEEVLAFAVAERRILVTLNRRHFIQLHNRRTGEHAGIVVCSYDPEFANQARKIHEALGAGATGCVNQLVRVNRGQ